MRTNKTLGTVVALVLISLTGSLFVAAPAVGAGTTPTSIAIEHKMKKGIFYDEVGPDMSEDGARDVAGYAGRLTDAGTGEPLNGMTLVLERKLFDEDSWTAVGEGVTQTVEMRDQMVDGVATVFTPVVATAKYRFTYAGDVTYAPSESATKALKAMRDFNAVVFEKKGQPYLKGNINPGWGGKKVSFQKKKGSKWVTIKTQKATKSGGFKFRGSYPPRLGMTWKFRARIPKSKGYVESVSFYYLETFLEPGRQVARTR